MYNASAAFHQAVADGADQMALLIFEDAVFTNDDIDVQAGIEFRDYFNMEEDIAIGQAVSNEISFNLFNDDRLLNTYAFGDFLATLGVLIGESQYQQTDGVKVVVRGATWTGHDVYPYVRRNGVAASAQPSFPVKSMLGYNGVVFAFGEINGDVRHAAYMYTGENITSSYSLNAFMKNKVKGWAGRSFCYDNSTRMLDVYDSGKKSTYEFVPLGYFTAERPKAPDTILISMTCNDFMMKLEDDMPSKSKLGITYPVTFKKLLEKICDYADVVLGTDSFINSSAKLTEEPKDFSHATMRDVVKWIAEAAGGNARFNRDGELIIDWVHASSHSLNEYNYAGFDPYWYETPNVDKVVNRGSDGSYSKSRGTGKQAYLIQDNPLLRGVS